MRTIAWLLLAVSSLSAAEPVRYLPTPQPLGQAGTAWWQVAVRPDGQELASVHGGVDQTGELLLWERTAGTVRQRHTQGQGLRCVAYRPTGGILATGGYEHLVRLHDAVSGQVVATGTGHADVVLALAFSADGTRLASGSRDGTVRVWTVTPTTLQPFAESIRYTQAMVSVALSADGSTLLAGGADHAARLWRLPKAPATVPLAALPALYTGARDAVTVALSPDGTLAAISEDQQHIDLYDLATQKSVRRLIGHKSFVKAFAFSPDGQWLVSAAGTPSTTTDPLRVWEVATGTQKYEFTGHTKLVRSVQFTPDSSTVVSLGEDETLWLSPLADKKQQRYLRRTDTSGQASQAWLAVAAAPDGQSVATAGDGQRVVVWQLGSKEPRHVLLGHRDVVAGLAYAPSGKLLASASYDRSVRLWDMATGKEQAVLAGHRNWVYAVAFAPDGRTLASGSYDKTIRLWDVATGKEQAVLTGHVAGVRAVAFTPDGKQLVSASADRTVRVWDVASRQLVHTLKGHEGVVRAVVVTPDGQTIISGSEDRTVRYWNRTSGEIKLTSPPATDLVTCLALAADGETLTIGLYNGQIASSKAVLDERAFDPVLSQLQVLTGHQTAVTALAFAGGRKLVSGGADEMVYVWTPQLTVDPALFARLTEEGQEMVANIRFSRNEVTSGLVAVPLYVGRPTNQSLSVNQVYADTARGRPQVLVSAVYQSDELGQSWSFTGVHLGDDKLVLTHDSNLWTPAIGERSWIELPGAPPAPTPAERRRQLEAHTQALRCTRQSTPLRTLPVLRDYADEKNAELPWGRIVGFAENGVLTAVAVIEAQTTPTGLLWQTRLIALTAGEMELSYNGKPLLSTPDERPTDSNKTVYEWRMRALAEPSLVAAWRNPGPAGVAVFTHDGRVLASGGGDGTLALRTTLPNTAGRTAFEMTTSAQAMTASADGKWLATGHAQQVHLWSTSTHKRVLTLPSGPHPLHSLAFSRDGQLLAGGTFVEGDVQAATTVTIWQTSDGKQRHAIPIPTGVNVLAWTSDGRTLAAGSTTGVVYLLDTVAGTLRSTLRPRLPNANARINSLAFAPDSQRLAVVVNDPQITFWHPTTGEQISAHTLGGWSLRQVMFSPDGRTLILSGAHGPKPTDEGVVLWDIQQQTVRTQLSTQGQEVGAWMCSADGNYVAVALSPKSGTTPDVVRCFALATGELVAELTGYRHWVADLCASGTGIYVSGSGLDNQPAPLTVHHWELAGLSPRAVLRGHAKPVVAAAFSAGGAFLASADAGGGLRLWDVNAALQKGTTTSRELPAHPAGWRCMAFSADGQWLAAGGADGVVKLFDPANGALLHTLPAAKQAIAGLAFSADSQSLAVAADTLTLWTAETGLLARTLPVNATAVAYLPDGNLLTAAADAGAIWNPATGKSVRAVPALTGATAFSIDVAGKRLATLRGDRSVRLWELATGQAIGRITSVPSPVHTLAFTPSGAAVVTGSSDGSTRVWDTSALRSR